MIGFLLELAAFQVGMNCAYQHAATKARRKYVKAVEAQFREFARWTATAESIFAKLEASLTQCY